MLALPDLSRRRREPEWMDDPEIDPEQHRRALSGLATINRTSFAARTILGALDLRPEMGPIRMLDVACGSGDVAVALEALARRRGLDVTVDGLDRSETALGRARERGARGRFFSGDALNGGISGGFDYVLCSLFLHHLAENGAALLLARMKAAARRGIVVSDLERGVPGYFLAAAATRLLTRSPVVHTDAVLSVRAAFRVPELRLLALRAGLRGFRIRRAWPFRLLLTWRRP